VDQPTPQFNTAAAVARADWPSDFLKTTNRLLLELKQLSDTAQDQEYPLTESDHYTRLRTQLTQLIERGGTLQQQWPTPIVGKTLDGLRLAQEKQSLGKPYPFDSHLLLTEMIDGQQEEDRRTFCRGAVEAVTRLYGQSGPARMEEFVGQLAGLGGMALEFLTDTPLAYHVTKFNNGREVLAAVLHALIDHNNSWEDRPSPHKVTTKQVEATSVTDAL
jgi:hypothetical protein